MSQRSRSAALLLPLRFRMRGMVGNDLGAQVSKPSVTSAVRLATFYLLALVAVSSLSVTFESVSPIDTPEGPMDWYSEIGFRNGLFVVAGHEPPGGGWLLHCHLPRFFPLPVWAGAGPESGGLYIATWFALGLLACTHFLFLARRRRKRRLNLGG
jgi:hypothetical protein